MSRSAPAAAILCLLSLSGIAAPGETAGAEEALHTNLKISLGYHYSTGTYGKAERTDIGYVPLTAKAEVDLWTFRLTVPYIRISGPAGVIEGPSGPIVTESGESDGLGDIVASGAYTVLPLVSWMPFVDLVGTIKFPSADENKGLGTGELDYTIETQLAQRIGRITPFATFGYRFVGAPPGTRLDDVWLASIGASYEITPPLSAGIFLNYREASSPSSRDQLDVTPFAVWKLTAHWSTTGYVLAGILDGSPDAGVGLQVGYSWW